MDEKLFEELLDSVKWMGRHRRGEAEAGRMVEFPDPDVKAIRQATRLSQSQFARLIGVKLKTLQNWEQQRVRPTGPARVLLRIVERNPKALEALHSPQDGFL
ncbi:MAG: transcriptional regulator [Pseudomonadota bacterium]|nr:transcriptional regulator [Pseudomonadota bacterium]